MLIARAPTRIDLGGGWTDVPPYPHEQGGFVCNVAITRHAIVRVRPGAARAPTDAPPSEPALVAAALRRAGSPAVHVSLENDFPVGAGLGGSSAAGVALAGALAAWRGAPLDAAALAEWSRATEVEELGVAGGFQDHYAAAFGGALALRFAERNSATRLALDADARVAIESRWILLYTGQSRISADTIAAVLDGYRARERRVTAALARMKALAEQMAEALERGAVDDVGALVGEHWVHQRALHPGITTARIDAIMSAAEHAGALGGKALGASGGGCVVVAAPADRVDAVREAVAPLGTLLSFAVDEAGFTVLHSGDAAAAEVTA